MVAWVRGGERRLKTCAVCGVLGAPGRCEALIQIRKVVDGVAVGEAWEKVKFRLCTVCSMLYREDMGARARVDREIAKRRMLELGIGGA